LPADWRNAAGSATCRCTRITEADARPSRLYRHFGDKPIWNDFLPQPSALFAAGLFESALVGFAPEAACTAACPSMFWPYRPTKSDGRASGAGTAVADRGGDNLAARTGTTIAGIRS